jgi:hypothetical protein
MSRHPERTAALFSDVQLEDVAQPAERARCMVQSASESKTPTRIKTAERSFASKRAKPYGRDGIVGMMKE